MSAKLSADDKGIYVIAATPFHDDGGIDFDSIDRLVDFYLRCGVHGMTVLGVMGEFQKLSESETIDVARRFIAAAKGRIPTIVGVSNPGTAQLTKIARTSVEAGAAGVMVMPMAGLKTDEAVLGYMRGVLNALGPSIPVCVQDYPNLRACTSRPAASCRWSMSSRRSPCSSTRSRRAYASCPPFAAHATARRAATCQSCAATAASICRRNTSAAQTVR
jgi:dihydrodipicolinate synthase/N-acetylneuraminate lyase